MAKEENKLYENYQNFLRKYYSHCDNFFLSDLPDLFDKNNYTDALEVRKAWNQYIQKNKVAKKKSVLNFYIHIPFCLKRCAYCLYYSRQGSSREIEDYVNWLIEQMAFFSDTFKGEEFNNLYIGGGTPSILSNRQISKLLKSLFNSFVFKKTGEKSFECNPSLVDLSKLKILKNFGINRVSFGVQSLDKKVLALANREYQKFNSVRHAIAGANGLGFNVNADLIVGLKGGNPKNFMDSFLKLAGLRPISITIYPFKPQGNQLENYLRKDFNSFFKENALEIESIYETLKANEKKLNYFVYEREKLETRPSSGILMIRIGSRQPADLYNAFYQRPSGLFSLGPKANGYIFNSLHYHYTNKDNRYNKFDPHEKKYWVARYSLKDEMRYFLLHKLSMASGFSQAEFKRYFGSDFEINFKKEIRLLKKTGDVKIKDEFIFFPADRFKRFACAMLLLDRDVVRATMESLI